MNMNIIKSIFLLFACIIFANASKAQLVNGCGFMQQNRLEVGVANNGAYGTPEDAPAGYHPNNSPSFSTMFNPTTSTYVMRPNALGFVADYDSNGWAIGTPPYFGDYFLPGTPQEGWAIEINGVRCDAFSSEFQANLTTGFTGTLTGTNQSVTTVAGVTTSIWKGNMGALDIKQTTHLKQNKLYFTANVKFYNTGGSTLQKVYYMRTLDPDNDVSTTGNFTTINDITYQLPNGGNKTLVGALSTVDTNAYLGLGTIDCRSKAFICNFGLFPPTDSLSYLFAGHPDLTYTGAMTQDVGIGVVYDLGDIAPGDSTELNFAYVLREASLDEALDEIKPKWLNNSNLYQSNDTIYACQNTVVPVAIVNGDDLSWTWTSTAPLSNTTGLSNNVTFGSAPVSVMAIGTGICTDTITFFVAVTDTIFTTINAGICSGAGYVFNGTTYTVGGTYSNVVTTAFGCDSIVTLNLFVGANTASSFTVALCQGAPGYLFNGALRTLAGQYFDTLINSVGCDSLVTLNLLVGNTTYGNVSAAICLGESYVFNGVPQTTAGIYTATLVNANGCDSIATLTLTMKPTPSPNFTMNPQVCTDDDLVVTYTGSSDPANIYTFNQGGATIISGSGAGPYVLHWNTPGVKNVSYQVTLNGCPSAPLVKQVTVIENPILNVKYDTSICIDHTAEFEAIPNINVSNFIWSFNDAQVVSGNPSNGGPLELSWSSSGTKFITVQTDNQGCLSNSITVNIDVHDLPPANIQIKNLTNIFCQTDIVNLTTDLIPNTLYQWQPLESFTRYDYNNADLIVIDFTTFVSLKVTDGFGCISTDTMTIYAIPCEEYFIPNSFTPNGDRLNDVFSVVGLQRDTKVEMMIYDRWGKQLFQSSDVKLGWNGKYKGNSVEGGVYFYVIKLAFPTGKAKVIKGDILVIY